MLKACLARVLFGSGLAVLLVFLLAPASALHAQVAEPDLSTPRRAMATFLNAVEREDWPRAISVLGVRPSAPAAKKEQAIVLSRQLDYVLSRSLGFQLDEVSDSPEGKPEDGELSEQVGAIRVNGHWAPIVLTRTSTSPARWIVSSSTLTSVPELYRERGPSPFEPYVPPSLRTETLGVARWQWLGLPLAALLSAIVAQLIVYLATRAGLHLAARTQTPWDDRLIRALRAPGRLFVSIFLFLPIAHAMSLPSSARLVVIRVAGTLALIATAWTLLRVVGLISDFVEQRAITAAANVSDAGVRGRGIRTKVRVLRRVISVVLAVCAGAVVLMQFEVVRSVGVSLLASAGLAGVVLGFAAQRTLGSLVGGIQLSITQPIRIGDDVIVESEFGTIEEITLTYVVVKLWDERRLVVPMSRFLEQPFQNWTKESAQLHGTVMLYADFALPVDAVRKELDRLLADQPLWDGRTKAVHVTDVKERTLEIRILVSAANGGALFNLRAELRERLVAWLVSLESGRYLSRTRVDEGPLDLQRTEHANKALAAKAPA
jgi:small-conductance mechanosensitive channel